MANRFKRVAGITIAILILFNDKDYQSACQDSSSEEVEVWQDFLLPPNYRKSLEPKTSNGDPVIVYTLLVIETITAIVEDKMEFYSNLYLSFKWEENRLNTSIIPAERSEELVRMRSNITEKLWRPITYIVNNRDRDRDIVLKGQYTVFFNVQQTIKLESWVAVRLFCPFHFQNYPFDRQDCYVRLQYDRDIRYVRLEFDTDENTSVYGGSSSMQLEVDEVIPRACVSNRSNGNFSCLELSVIFQRRLGTHVTQTFIPSILVVILSWFSFWLEVDAAPARISLGITALLTLTTSFSQTQSSLPPVSYMRAIDLWMFTCIFIVFLTMVEFTVAYSLNRSDEEENKNSQATVRFNGNSKYPKFVFKASNRKWGVHFMKNKGPRNRGILFDLYARIFFPSSFIIFTIGYWFYYMYI